MDPRAEQILDHIIEQYIQTAEPVGSRAISKLTELNLSAATIRNVMSDLTEVGMLSQPHTSAGRVPTDRAYRYYVDKLQKNKPEETIQDEVWPAKRPYERLEDLLYEAAQELTEETHCTGLLLSPRPASSKLNRVELIGISGTQVLVVLVTQAGMVKNRIITLKECPEQEDLNLVASKLCELFLGHAIGDIHEGLLETLAGKTDRLSAHAIRIGKKALEIETSGEVYISGGANLCGFPEFNNQASLKKVYQEFEDKRGLSRILNEMTRSAGLHVTIGSENQAAGLESCSILARTYGTTNSLLGSIGIIGPTRIDYPKVIKAIDRSSRKLSYAVDHFLNSNT